MILIMVSSLCRLILCHVPTVFINSFWFTAGKMCPLVFCKTYLTLSLEAECGLEK